MIEENLNNEAYFNIGFSKSKLGAKSGAIQDYNKVIELDPDFKEAYNNMEICKYELRDNSRAIQ